jgi:hypothetical protein
MKKRRSGIPSGNAGEYFVMGELLRRGYDVQLADRNTKGYDILVGRPDDSALRKVQVKTVRTGAWFVELKNFTGDLLDQVTIYVRLGKEGRAESVRYFVTPNREVAQCVDQRRWQKKLAFMNLKAVEPWEGRWEVLDYRLP